jgi:hypothetical protein
MTPWIKDWIEALRSKKYGRIMTDDMWNIEGEYSALGILCEISGCKKTRSDDKNLAKQICYLETVLGSKYAENLICQIGFDPFVELNCYRKNDTDSNRCIPIDLTGKLGCNSPLMILGGAKNYVELIIDGKPRELSVYSLDECKSPFEEIAEFIEDNWEYFTFRESQKMTKDIIEKNYGTFLVRKKEK